jgi:hypothetical protein
MLAGFLAPENPVESGHEFPHIPGSGWQAQARELPKVRGTLGQNLANTRTIGALGPAFLW